MSRNESLLPVAKFIAEYSAHMMGCGVHTSRVVRSSKRIGEAYGADVKISIFQKNIILTISDNDTKETYSEVDRYPRPSDKFREERQTERSELGNV